MRVFLADTSQMKRIIIHVTLQKMVLLLASFLCVLQPDGSSLASAEWLQEDIFSSSSESEPSRCEGRGCLLPIIPSTPAADPRPWGSGIRFGVDIGGCSFWILPDANVQLMMELLPRAGPMHCVEFANGSWPRNQVTSDEIDLLVYRTFLMSVDEPTLYPHAQGDVCVVLAKDPPFTLTIANTFSSGTWLLTAAALTAFALAQREMGLPAADAILDTFGTFLLGCFLVRSHRRLSNALSLLLSAFGVVMVTAFSAKFTSFLAVSSEPPQVQTLEEVNARVSVVYDTARLQRLADLFDADDVARHLLAKSEEIFTSLDWETRLPQVAESRDVAMLMSVPQYVVIKRHRDWMDEATGRSLVQLVPECVLAPAYVAFPVHRGWRHAPRFSAMVQTAVEAGLYLRCHWNAQFNLQKAGMRLPDWTKGASAEPEALRLAALLQPAVVLAAGGALAAAVFLAEWITFRWGRGANQGGVGSHTP